jgi:predicted MarR family transcription regulator
MGLFAVTGITNKSLRAGATAITRQPYSRGQASYDLRRLRLKGLVVKRPRSNTYDLTEDGRRFALFYTKVHDRVLAPLMTADRAPAPPELSNALRVIDTHVGAYTTRAGAAT